MTKKYKSTRLNGVLAITVGVLRFSHDVHEEEALRNAPCDLRQRLEMLPRPRKSFGDVESWQ